LIEPTSPSWGIKLRNDGSLQGDPVKIAMHVDAVDGRHVVVVVGEQNAGVRGGAQDGRERRCASLERQVSVR
jgi:hypothetical protein